MIGRVYDLLFPAGCINNLTSIPKLQAATTGTAHPYDDLTITVIFF
jgi:hypothetical protein